MPYINTFIFSHHNWKYHKTLLFVLHNSKVYRLDLKCYLYTVSGYYETES